MKPCGIYALDSPAGTHRDANIRSYPFVTGYTLRVSWATMEPTLGVYDFATIDHIVSKLSPLGKKLTLEVYGKPAEPAYLATHPGALVQPSGRVVPWDPYSLERLGAFAQALGDHQVSGVAFRDHPVLANISLGIPGFGGIRVPGNGQGLENLPGYSRSTFINAILAALGFQVTHFPNRYGFVGFWKIEDDVAPVLWEATRDAILAAFGDKVGFFMENLAASKANGIVTGSPGTNYGAPLYSARNDTSILFQALTSWKQPFTGAEKVAGATPADGIQYAHDTYNAAYVELYVTDLDNQPWWPEFEQWHAQLCQP